MCQVYERDVIYPNGRRVARHHIQPCPNGTTTSPCPRFALFREGAIDAGAMPRHVDGRPRRDSTSLNARRGANPLRLEWEFHIPFTSRSGSSSGSRRPSDQSSPRGILGFGPVATPVTYNVHPRRQFVEYTPADFAGAWQTWTPPAPRVITVDPARHTPPETPSRGRRAQSVDAVAGREHTRSRSYSRRRSTSSRPSGHHISPPLRPRDASPASLDGDRARRIREINARLETLERDLVRARTRNSPDRITVLERQIEHMRRQRRPPPRTVEVHQGERTAVRLPHHSRHHRSGESIDERGRRVLQRDVDAGAARHGVGASSRPQGSRRLTNGDRDRADAGFWNGIFRRPSLRRSNRDHIVMEGEPRGGERHR